MTNALYPIAKKRPKLKTLHREVSTDDYAWLRDDNWQKVMREPETLNPEIRRYLDELNNDLRQFTVITHNKPNTLPVC